MVAVTWSFVPLVVIMGHVYAKPIFLDFGVELPTVTRLMMAPQAPYVLGGASLLLMLVALMMPPRRYRRALIAGLFVLGFVACSFVFISIVMPMLSVLQELAA